MTFVKRFLGSIVEFTIWAVVIFFFWSGLVLGLGWMGR